MIDNLIIAKDMKKTILYLEKVLENFPNSEKCLRDNIISTNYEILELIYLTNELKDKESNQKKIIAKIKMLDFYLKISMEKGYISYKKYTQTGNFLIEIIKKIRCWINNEES